VFDFENIKWKKIAVFLANEKEEKEFLDLAEKEGLKWEGQKDRHVKENYQFQNRDEVPVCVDLQKVYPGYKVGMMFGNRKWYEDNGFEIISFEDMKEGIK